MGLVPTPEHEWAKDSIQSMADIASTYLDLEAIEKMAHQGSGQAGRAAHQAALALKFRRICLNNPMLQGC